MAARPPAQCRSIVRSALRRVSLVVLAAILVLVVAPVERSPAAALPGPAHFSTGLVDDSAFQFSSDAVRTLWLRRARAVGSTAVRVDVSWAAVAPVRLPRGFQAANPRDRHYRWATLDATVRAASANRQTVVLTLYEAPAWAEGADRPSYVRAGAWEPSPRAYAAFAHAVAVRYSGHFPDPGHPGRVLPRVRYFQAWNEPNLPGYLMPQWVRGAGGSIVAASPGIYRSLLNALYGAVKTAQPHSYVLAAGTAPYGDPPGVDRMYPLVFLRGLFCLTSNLRSQPCPDPPHLDALDHHPYAITPTVHARIPGDVSVPDLKLILEVLHAAQRDKHVLPAGPKSLWVTEIDWSTYAHVLHPISLALQLAICRWRSTSSGARASATFSGSTSAIRPDRSAARRMAASYLEQGTAKPSATAFRFPFVAVPASHRDRTLWGKAPAAGTVTIEKLVKRHWVSILRLHTTAGGVFYARRRLGAHR